MNSIVVLVVVVVVVFLFVLVMGWLWWYQREKQLTQPQRVLVEAFPGATLLTETSGIYHPRLRDRMHPYNPSMFFYHGQRYLVHRLSTFNMCRNILQHLPEFLSTKERHGVLNSIVLQTPRGHFIVVDVPHENAFPCPEAYVDPRSLLFRGDLVLVVNNPQHERCRKTTMVALFFRLGDPEDLECASLLTPYRVLDLEYTDGRPVEKNWMPFVYQNALHFVYRVSPHIVLRCDTDTGVCTRVAETHHTGPSSLRGGTPCVLLEDWGWYLAVAHIRHAIGGVKLVYHSVLYAFEREPPFRVVAVSDPFFLDSDFEPHRLKQIIQFAAGLAVKEDRIHISYGSGDCSSRVLSLPLDDALGLLRPLDTDVKSRSTRGVSQ